ncbi:membrane protein [Oceanobacillus oncorhynchi subsp. incaldanensis]|uniref:Tripartite tricarboxylate transporter TctA family protein n=1 Tax=Oceanobacillus oncorhynchi TaxID=545501 RepID=A0A0A1M986_9BACI|nr:tripartite tricarboxylate transporter permease [Oceanobacillus oncorhynchi]UUI40474.1 tripartite tricarboxylate transporter permease [Oceanobacillus oncorhynchi]GIO18595.1 membrane protein [Oceanobacillus oncorhynchi subsp. incaldanensis]CEI81895.1 Tripartite tricarboxylate transporter TctA family protein [Oceanobacillus oncorhynchi]
MIEWQSLMDGIVMFMNWFNFLLIILGLLLGVILGAIPGLTGSLGIALMLPVTFTMEPLSGLVFLIAIYTGGLFGGAITAVLINTPGSPAAVATTLDGYPMTKQGQPGKALGLAVGSSAIGGMIGGFVLLLIIQPLASFALKFGPTEMFLVAVFGLTIISSIQEGGFVKSIFGGLFGVLLGTIGMTDTGAVRGTFDNVYLLDGIPMIPALIGLFAVSELFFLADKQFVSKQSANQNLTSQMLKGIKSIFRYPFNLIRSSAIGVFVGALPAAGSTIASLLSYNEAKRFSKSKDKFGKGNEEGIVAAESANNASEGGALATMLVLGIPGSASTAMLLGAIIMQGWVPGPRLFIEQSTILYGVIFSMVVGLFFLIFVGGAVSLGAGRVINIPTRILIPIIIVFALIGAFATRNLLFDAFLVFIFGIIGWYLRRNKYPVIAVVLGLILGPIADSELLKSVQLHGSETINAFLTRPVSIILIIITILGVFLPIILDKLNKKSKVS